ncbi:YhdP family protein [Phytopseudomonas dryadis]|uniref:TIGR02099 family protein n=1 Tax=Phytopseudomonas dryadis TaxID=2487520 RepID=A0ABY1Z4D9_9GAMM|nr:MULTISPECIES: YhdP family protein [Pseudomonas]TBV04089.1 TIGR02099 family protein [Pseudomonas dryadis]TBV17019.1 TIGR02099 family protein [Pseudomonas sp. FRB 230]
MERLLLALAALLRWSLGLCAFGLVLAALYVSLGRELAPLVAEYREEAEARASEALGLPVRIGALEGHWRGFSPWLIVRDLQLGDGADALRLQQVRVVPDLLASLLAWQPRIADLQLDGVRLAVRQDEQGGWSVEGLPQRADQPPLDIAEVLRQSQRVARVSLFDSQISVAVHGQEPLILQAINLSLRNGSARQRLDARLQLPDGQPLALQLRTRLQAEHWQDASAELYLNLPQSDWATWLPPGLTRDWRLEHLQLGGELWARWGDKSLQRAVTRLQVPQLAGRYAEREAVALENLAVNAYVDRVDQGFDVLLDDLAFSRGDTRWGESRIALGYRAPGEDADAQRWSIAADRLDLGPLVPLTEALAPLPDTAMDVLHELQPHGALRNLNARFRPQVDGPERLQFSANLERIGFSAWHASPAVENGSGSISGDLGQGELKVDSEDFSLHLETLFPQAWNYRQAKGRLTWTLNDEGFTLRAPYLQVVGEEGRLAGDFLIRLLKDPAAEDYMDLRVGMRDGDARFTEKYLPTPVLSPALDDWLKTAIRAGTVDEGYFQYQGSINRNPDPSVRSISLFFGVRDAELAFQPGWPALRDARGEVLIEDSGVRVRVAEGHILDSRVSDAQADIAHVDAGKVPRLKLQGQLQSSVGDALKILQDAPLGLADTFTGWKGEGALTGALTLDLPLQQGMPADVVVDFSAKDATLSLSDPALALTKLSGDFRYDTRSGLSAPSIRAEALGHALRGKAVADGQRGKARSRIEANGVVPLANLTRWLGVTQPLPASGSIPYRLRLSLEGADSQLRVDSNLKGLAIRLPAPFGKASGDERYTDWRMSLGGREQRYWLDYADLASFAFVAPPGQLGQGRGELRLGDGPAILPGTRGVRLRGRVAELDLSAWQEAIKPYTSLPRDDAQQLFSDAQLRIGRFSGLGQTLDDLEVGLKPANGAWTLNLDSALLKGRIDLPQKDGVPIVADLEYLRLPAMQPKSEDAVDEDTPDPLADFDPRQIPALDLRIAHVFQGPDDMGAWSLKARPDAQGVLFSALDINLKGLQMTGSVGWQGGAGQTRSWYKGRMQGKQLSNVLKAWGYAPTATSETFHLDADGHWPGSPAWFSLKRYSGSLDASLRKGQFVEVQGSASALRVFGLLNFNSIGRRLRLDFSDLLDKGLSYDRVKGNLTATNGVFVTQEPITMTGPSSNLELNGTLNMVNQGIDAKLLVTLPVTNNLPLAALIVGAPAIGGALFIADKLLGDRVARFASVQYDVRGSLHDPQITFDKPFEKPN